jgi:hypothetical protein
MDDIPLCPDWWPLMLWKLHFPPKHIRWVGPPPPVNFPLAIDDLMANLHIHTLTYLMLDQGAAQQVRKIAEERMADTAQSLSRLHNEARMPVASEA